MSLDQNKDKLAKSSQSESFSFVVDKGNAGRQRLDQFCASQDALSDITRSKIKSLIDDGMVLVNGMSRKPSYRIQVHDEVSVVLPPLVETDLVAEDVSFDILYEDAHVVVVSKPPGLVVHPACGHQSGTLVHGLLYHCDNLSGLNGEERPGIVHRLDKDTSGVMVVAKNDNAHNHLVQQFQERQITKIYRAILDGCPSRSAGRVSLPIGRHPVNRKKMAVNEKSGREAVTNWRVLETFADGFSYVELNLETGRTHQIRVHMAALGHPVAGDNLYGKKHKNIARKGITRQCLHAFQLSFKHPVSGKWLDFEAPIWPDMLALLEKLKAND